MSKAQKFNASEVDRWLENYDKLVTCPLDGRILVEEHHCEYGHFGCSTYDDGPCHDEVLGIVESRNG